MAYWKVRNKLTVVDELLMFDLRIVVPQCDQIETLGKIHYDTKVSIVVANLRCLSDHAQNV